MFQDSEGLMQTLKPQVSGSDAWHVVSRKFRAAHFGLVFSQLVVQRAYASVVQVFQNERRQSEEPVGDVACDCRETFSLHLHIGHERLLDATG
jgi:hypothetical protein